MLFAPYLYDTVIVLSSDSAVEYELHFEHYLDRLPLIGSELEFRYTPAVTGNICTR
jgi:hypothetical protein